MPKSKLQKEKDLRELTDLLKNAKSAVISDYRGTTVKNMDKLRKTLRQEKVFSKVYKITLLKRALQALGLGTDGVDYKAPVILSISQDDETSPARNLKKMSKELQTVKILEGLLNGKLVDGKTIEALADLPSKEQLRGRLVATINAPVSGFVKVLAGNLRGLVNVLKAMSKEAA